MLASGTKALKIANKAELENQRKNFEVRCQIRKWLVPNQRVVVAECNHAYSVETLHWIGENCFEIDRSQRKLKLKQGDKCIYCQDPLVIDLEDWKQKVENFTYQPINEVTKDKTYEDFEAMYVDVSEFFGEESKFNNWRVCDF